MRSLIRALFPLVAVSVVACQPPSPGPSLADDVRLPPSSALGRRQLGLTLGDGANGAHIIFLNFDGAQLKAPPPGYDDDSAQNESWIAGTNVSYPAFDAAPYGPALSRVATINAITNVFKQIYAPFNVEVVTSRPATGRYTMCMIGGGPEVVGEAQGTAGVAPLDCGNQNEAEVTYAFANVLSPNNTGSATLSLKAIASTAAQETAHSYGLGHTTNQADIMYPQLLPGQDAFGGPSALQDDGSGQCSPTSVQDSAGMLLDLLGAAGANPVTGPVPKVAFIAPTQGSIVPPTFEIAVSAQASSGTIAHVEVSNGGKVVFDKTTPPYRESVTAPNDGMYELTATAYDSNGNFKSSTVRFTVQAGAPPQQIGCVVDADCNAGLTCQGGQCDLPPEDGPPAPGPAAPAPGETGAACTDSSECTSGLCAELAGAQYCTEACDPMAPACPDTMICSGAGEEYYCAPQSGASGGCAVGSPAARSSASTTAGLAFLVAALALLWTRRRAR